jgi:hypothetical protein
MVREAVKEINARANHGPGRPAAQAGELAASTN